jgi:hypothetical protein
MLDEVRGAAQISVGFLRIASKKALTLVLLSTFLCLIDPSLGRSPMNINSQKP